MYIYIYIYLEKGTRIAAFGLGSYALILGKSIDPYDLIILTKTIDLVLNKAHKMTVDGCQS